MIRVSQDLGKGIQNWTKLLLLCTNRDTQFFGICNADTGRLVLTEIHVMVPMQCLYTCKDELKMRLHQNFMKALRVVFFLVMDTRYMDR